MADQPCADVTKTQGPAEAVTQPLGEAECLRLLAAGGVGRIGYSGRYGPTILPVNFALHGQTIVFRTGQHSPMDEDLRTGMADAAYKVAFEVNEISPATREGWSILVQGAAHHVELRSRTGRGPANGRAALAGRGERPVHPHRPGPGHRPPDQPGRPLLTSPDRPLRPGRR